MFQFKYDKDKLNVLFLTFLYFLQSVPLGLIGSLPYILSSRSVSYAEQAFFSFAFWPFSLKLLWAPIVDSIYNKYIGKRKTWLIPVQYMIGFMLIFSSDYVKGLLDNNNGNNTMSNIKILTAVFFCLAFLAATQDIVVDGWSLTLFNSNTSLGSTCESTGGTAGWFVGNVLFLVIESADLSNQYIRPLFGLESQTYGIVTIKEFMIFFGALYIATTTLVVIFKKESQPENADALNLVESYQLVWKIICLKPIQLIILVVFTLRLSFGTESMLFLKLVEAGIPKEKIGLLTIPLTPLQFVLPFLIGKALQNISPFKYFSLSILFRSIIIVVFSLWIYVTPFFKLENNEYHIIYYIVTIFLQGLHSITVYSSYMPLMYFFSSISDKNYGATYLTFFNTVANVARSITSTSTLYIADFLTYKYCQPELTNTALNVNSTLSNKCITDWEKENCIENGGKCAIYFDSFYLQTFVSFIISVCWLIWIRRILDKLEQLPKTEWKVYENKLKLKTK